MLRLILECERTNIIREFEEVENADKWELNNSKYYQESKITLDKENNILNRKDLKTISQYTYDKYVWKLKQQGYIEIYPNKDKSN